MADKIGRSTGSHGDRAGANGNMWRRHAYRYTSKGTAKIEPPPPTKPRTKPTAPPDPMASRL
jgi:hypothetical protein